MILRFGNVIYDLKYAEKIALSTNLLLIRFANGREEVIDLREYNCRPEILIELIFKNKNKPIGVSYPKLSEKEKNS